MSQRSIEDLKNQIREINDKKNNKSGILAEPNISKEMKQKLKSKQINSPKPSSRNQTPSARTTRNIIPKHSTFMDQGSKREGL
jgi:hypothetical protein